MLQNSRKQQYIRLEATILNRLRQNSQINTEERQKLEKELSQCVRKLDLKMILNLYCRMFSEEAHIIRKFF